MKLQTQHRVASECACACVSHSTVTKANRATVLFVNVFLQAVVNAIQHVDGVSREDAETKFKAGVCYSDEEERSRT